MRITRILATGAIAIALWSASATAAFADDPPPADPPPASEPPPEPDPVPEVPLPESEPLIDPPSSTPDGVFIPPPAAPEAPPVPYKTLEEILAESQAVVDKYLAGIFSYYATHPGGSLDYVDGVWRDGAGNIVDLDAKAGSTTHSGSQSAPTVVAPSVFSPTVATLDAELSSVAVPVAESAPAPEPTEEDSTLVIYLSVGLLALAIFRGGKWARARAAAVP